MAWLQYNKWMLQFGLGLTSGQTYKSNPLGWLFLARPISFYSSCLPAKRCGGVGSTEQEVLAIGTPADLVGRRRGDRVLPDLVAYAARLASRGRAAGHRRRVAAVDLVLPA